MSSIASGGDRKINASALSHLGGSMRSVGSPTSRRSNSPGSPSNRKRNKGKEGGFAAFEIKAEPLVEHRVNPLVSMFPKIT